MSRPYTLYLLITFLMACNSPEASNYEKDKRYESQIDSLKNLLKSTKQEAVEKLAFREDTTKSTIFNDKDPKLKHAFTLLEPFKVIEEFNEADQEIGNYFLWISATENVKKKIPFTDLYNKSLDETLEIITRQSYNVEGGDLQLKDFYISPKSPKVNLSALGVKVEPGIANIYSVIYNKSNRQYKNCIIQLKLYYKDSLLFNEQIDLLKDKTLPSNTLIAFITYRKLKQTIEDWGFNYKYDYTLISLK